MTALFDMRGEREKTGEEQRTISRAVRDKAMRRLGEAATGWHLRGSRGRHMLAWGLAVLLTILGSAAASEPAVTALLGGLNLSGYAAGTKPPNFGGRTVEGRTVSLAGLQGRVVLLNFWASWCLECRPEMPLFEELHRELAAEGLAVLGVNVREGTPTILSYARDLGLTFPLVLDPRGEISKSYGVIGLPTTFLIARDGRAVAWAIGGRDWGTANARALIQALLAEPAVPKGAR